MSLADRLVTRRLWGAAPPRERHAIPGPLRGNTGHYEGPHMGTPDHSHCAGLVRGIQDFHMNDPDRRWLDIAYSSMFCPHGSVFEGRWLGIRTAANGTDIGNMITDAFQFKQDGSHHQCAQRDLNPSSAFNGLAKSRAVREA